MVEAFENTRSIADKTGGIKQRGQQCRHLYIINCTLGLPGGNLLTNRINTHTITTFEEQTVTGWIIDFIITWTEVMRDPAFDFRQTVQIVNGFLITTQLFKCWCFRTGQYRMIQRVAIWLPVIGNDAIAILTGQT